MTRGLDLPRKATSARPATSSPTTWRAPTWRSASGRRRRVNPIAETRAAWREVAASVGAPCLEVEVVCSDLAEHRRRVEGRLGDPAALQPPAWAEVEGRAYEPWPDAQLRLDTAVLDPDTAAASVCEAALARHA